jgi:hypothetical protein
MENLCKTPLASMDYTKGMTYGSLLAGAAMAYSGCMYRFPMPQYYTGCMAAGAAFDYYCRGEAFALDNRLAQEMVAAAVAGYVVTAYR